VFSDCFSLLYILCLSVCLCACIFLAVFVGVFRRLANKDKLLIGELSNYKKQSSVFCFILQSTSSKVLSLHVPFTCSVSIVRRFDNPTALPKP